MACRVSLKYESGRNGGTRRRAELRGDDGSDVSVSAEREGVTASLCSVCTHSAVTQLPLTAMTDAEDGDAGGDTGGLMMTVIMVIMPSFFFVLLVPCSQTPFPIHHTSPAPLLPWPLQVHHHNCQGDLIRPHYVRIIRHACSCSSHLKIVN